MKTKQNRSYAVRTKAIGMGAAMLSFLFLLTAPMEAKANYDKEEDGTYTEDTDYESDQDIGEEIEYEEGGVVRENNGGTPFSVAGNGEILDDAVDDETKEFFTVQTENNQTFFIVIDRSSATDNVYMLSMIDEEDLMEFVPDAKKENALGITLQQEKTDKEIAAQEEEEAQKKEEQKKKKDILGTIFFLIFVAVAVALTCGIYYYIKFYKPRRDEENAENEDLERSDVYGSNAADEEKEEVDDTEQLNEGEE